MEKGYIVLYAEDFDTDVWEAYCVSAGVPLSAIEIKIRFDYNDVEYHEDDESEEESSDDLYDYKIVTEDGDEYFYTDYPTTEDINGFIKMGKDITIYEYDCDNVDDWEEVETYHA